MFGNIDTEEHGNAFEYMSFVSQFSNIDSFDIKIHNENENDTIIIDTSCKTCISKGFIPG